MSVEGLKFSYPGADATALQILELAGEYRRSAQILLPLGRRGEPLSRAPFRLLAIHSIELHLNAFLRARGFSASQLRGLQHDLAARADAATARGLILRKRTATHVRELAQTREYLATRYDPVLSAASQINRLEATLEEIAAKVTAAMRHAR